MLTVPQKNSFFFFLVTSRKYTKEMVEWHPKLVLISIIPFFKLISRIRIINKGFSGSWYQRDYIVLHKNQCRRNCQYLNFPDTKNFIIQLLGSLNSTSSNFDIKIYRKIEFFMSIFFLI